MSRLHPIPFPYGAGVLLEPAPHVPAHDERIVIPARRRRKKGNDNA